MKIELPLGFSIQTSDKIATVTNGRLSVDLFAPIRQVDADVAVETIRRTESAAKKK